MPKKNKLEKVFSSIYPVVLRGWVFFHLVAITITSMPPPGKIYPTVDKPFQNIDRYLKPHFWNYIYGNGLGQNWEMFGHIDGYIDTWFEAEITFTDKSSFRIPLAKASEEPLWKSFTSMRDLFQLETLSALQNQLAFRGIARHIASSYTTDKTTPSMVDIIVRWRPPYLYAEPPKVDYFERSVFAYNNENKIGS